MSFLPTGGFNDLSSQITSPISQGVFVLPRCRLSLGRPPRSSCLRSELVLSITTSDRRAMRPRARIPVGPYPGWWWRSCSGRFRYLRFAASFAQSTSKNPGSVKTPGLIFKPVGAEPAWVYTRSLARCSLAFAARLESALNSSTLRKSAVASAVSPSRTNALPRL